MNIYRHTLAEGKEDVVRRNMESHGYRRDLRHINEAESDENMNQIRKDYKDMPRYKISEKPEWFGMLMRLLDVHGEVANNSWNFLKTLCTNPYIYSKVLRLDKNEKFDWSEIFDKNNVFRMLYSLQILESLLEVKPLDSVEKDSEEYKNLEQKIDWVHRFLKIGGVEYLIKLFDYSH